MLFSQSRLWLLCLVRLRTTCNSHCTDREKAIWLRATNNRSDANCQSVMFLLTIVQLLCVPTGPNCTMPLNFFPHLLYQTMGTLVCAVWGTDSLWCVVTESLLCWPIEPGSTSVLLIEETSGQQLCNDKAIRPSVGLGCWTNAEKAWSHLFNHTTIVITWQLFDTGCQEKEKRFHWVHGTKRSRMADRTRSLPFRFCKSTYCWYILIWFFNQLQ